MFYIISLKHTYKGEQYLSLWRDKNAGYVYAKEGAGLYETPEPGYHDSDTNMPISEDEANKLFVKTPNDIYGAFVHLIPNTKPVWEALGVKMTKRGLQKLPAKTK